MKELRIMQERGIVLALVGLVLAGLVGPVGGASAHEGICETSDEDVFLRVANPVHETGTLTEYAYFVVLAQGRDDDLRNSLNGEGVDAFVKDLGCHTPGLSFTVTASSEVEGDDPEVLIRYYDHFGLELDQTDCAQQLTTTTPATTQYIVMVACGELPNSFEGLVPYTVRAELDFPP